MEAIDSVLVNWMGTSEQIAAINQFARDYAWGGAVDDPAFAADEVVGELTEGIEAHPDAVARLRAALEACADGGANASASVAS